MTWYNCFVGKMVNLCLVKLCLINSKKIFEEITFGKYFEILN